MRKFLITILTIFISCDSTDCCFNISADIYVSVLDIDNNDILNPDNSSVEINLNEIPIFYQQRSGNKLFVNNTNYDSPKGYDIIVPSNSSNHYKIKVYLNTDYINDENVSFTYVEWKNGDIDELKAKFSINDKSKTVEKIWVNGILKWKRDPNNDLLIIVK